MRNHFRRRLLIEGLEIRRPLAFSITSSGTSISLVGDNEVNTVAISVAPSGHFRHNLPLGGFLVSDIDTDRTLIGEQAILATSVTSIAIIGGNNNDIIDASAWTGGGIAVRGGDGNDVIRGGLGGDDLWGEGGDDTLEGNGGNDQLFGDGANFVSSTGSDVLRGGDGNDVLRGDDYYAGGTGNDVLEGGAGDDALHGNGGNDLVYISSTTFLYVIAGDGYDKLFFVGSGIHLDLVVADKVTGVEEIDVTGSGDNSLTINRDRVLSSSDTDTMIVRGNLGDAVNKGSGWTFTGTEAIAGSPFKVYTQDAATLKIQFLADIELAPTVVAETAAINAAVGVFSTIDVDPANTFSYSLVSGTGDSGNSAFVIDGPTLRVNTVLDFETQSSYSIRVRATDQDGVFNEEVFTITVTNIDEAPVLTRAQAVLTGNVLSTFTNTGTWRDPEGAAVTLAASHGTIVKNDNGTWSWSFVPTQGYTNQTITISATDAGGLYSDVQFTLDAIVTVVNSKVYYKGSVFAGNGVNAALDGSKVIAKSGTSAQTLTFANLINTTRGINGLVFDVAGLAAATLIASDFSLRMSPTGDFNEAANPPSNWVAAPTPTLIAVTPGAGMTPARVRLEWPDNAIANRWLQIKLLANGNTGLRTPQVYYLGHLAGETNGSLEDGSFRVRGTDTTPIVAQISSNANVTIDNIYDLNKDGRVRGTDSAPAVAAVGNLLRRITIPPAGSTDEGEFDPRSIAIRFTLSDPLSNQRGSDSEETGVQEIRARWTEATYDLPAPPKTGSNVADATFSDDYRNRGGGRADTLSPQDLWSLDEYFQWLGRKRSQSLARGQLTS